MVLRTSKHLLWCVLAMSLIVAPPVVVVAIYGTTYSGFARADCQIIAHRSSHWNFYVGVLGVTADSTEAPYWVGVADALFSESTFFRLREKFEIGSVHTCYYCLPIDKWQPKLAPPACVEFHTPWLLFFIGVMYVIVATSCWFRLWFPLVLARAVVIKRQ